ncbi:MAG: hypothetical protein ACI9WU_001378 [Myxococcota bacterium]|jgi:hypothetical protein
MLSSCPQFGTLHNATMSRRFKLGLIAGMVLIVSVVVATMWQRSQVPETGPFSYTAPRLAGEITIDGRLGDTGWDAVAPTRAFIRSDGTAYAPRHCAARLAWDNDALYVAFDVADDDVDSPFTERDQDLWTRDVAEIYLDPESDAKNYYEIQISPNGVLFDALFPAYRENLERSRKWNAPGIEFAARQRGGGWTAELRVPFSAIRYAKTRRPKPGDSWAMNLYRIDIHPDGRGDYTAWTPPIVGDFHALDRFGTLVFGE